MARSLAEDELSPAHGLPSAYPDWSQWVSGCWEKFQGHELIMFSVRSRGGWQQLHVNWRELVTDRVRAEKLKRILMDIHESKYHESKESNIGRKNAEIWVE